MKKIVFTLPDGRVSVMYPAPWARLVSFQPFQVEGVQRAVLPFDVLARMFKVEDISRLPVGLFAEWAETEDAFVERIAATYVPADAINVRVVDEASLPAGRLMREAWVQDANGSVVLCPVKTEALKKSEVYAQLAATDAWMSRGSEDTIVKLIEKGLMTKADYNPTQIERINIRRGLRGEPLI